MKNIDLTCVGCGGKFSLTIRGTRAQKENKLNDPLMCRQCTIIANRNKNMKIDEKEDLKTNSTFWTEERLNEYEDKRKRASNGLYTNMKLR